MADISQVINIIFSGIMKRTEGVDIRRQEFVKTFNNPKIFKNEYYIFAVLVKEYPKLALSKDFVENFMKANQPSLETSPNVEMGRYKISDEVDNFEEFLNSVKLMHDDLQKVNFTKEDYLESLELYKMHYINQESITLLEESTQILAEGIKERGKLKVGYDDMREHLKRGFLTLDDLSTKTERKGLITYGINDMDDAAVERDEIKIICPYGIKGIDKAFGGIYEGEMISLLAPAKGGKSRFATYVLHNAVINGVNIIMWSIENGYKGWEALMRARHFEYFYNNNLTDASKRQWLDDDAIRKGKMEPAVKEMELASWTDLKSNNKYGKISSIDEEFNIDTFIEVLENAIDATDAKFICVDYLQLVQGTGRASKQEKVAEAYQKCLQLIKMKRIAGIFPAQLKQTALGMLNKTEDADLASTELRDAAGESYEVIKTPDVNLALHASPEELTQGRIKLLSMPSRNHAPFKPIILNCDMGSCTFIDSDTVSR